MRIVIAGYHPADPGRIVGGVEAITLRLAEGLAALGEHEIHAVTTREDVVRARTVEAPGWTVHLLPRTRALGNLTLMWKDRRGLREVFDRLQPDVIHAHSTSEFALAALESGFPTVVSIHGIVREEARLAAGTVERLRGRARAQLEARVLRRVRDVIVVSPYVVEAFGHHFREARTHTIETSVSERFFAVERRPEPERVLFAGLIIPRKGVLELVESARLLCERRPGVRILLAGAETDPPYASRVREAIAAAGLNERVALLGGLSAESLAAELSRATLLVLPSFQETAPIAIQEAMAAGVPVVATDVGGNRHLVRDGETGRLVPAGDTRALAAAMNWVMEDTSRALTLGTAARETARERFAPLAVARRSVEVYRDVCARVAR